MKKAFLSLLMILPVFLIGQYNGETTEFAPGYRDGGGGRATGDIIWSLDVETITGDNQCLGAEFDGTYLWVSGGALGTDPNHLYKIDPYAGVLLNTYLVPAYVTGWGLRDLCWIEEDGLLYGGWENGFFSFDPATGIFTELFNSQPYGTIRALAWDGTYFWTKNFSAPLTQFDISGVQQSSYPAPVDSA
jgi:hypothetical protein